MNYFFGEQVRSNDFMKSNSPDMLLSTFLSTQVDERTGWCMAVYTDYININGGYWKLSPVILFKDEIINIQRFQSQYFAVDFSLRLA